jgi:hypothetical protein
MDSSPRGDIPVQRVQNLLLRRHLGLPLRSRDGNAAIPQLYGYSSAEETAIDGSCHAAGRRFVSVAYPAFAALPPGHHRIMDGTGHRPHEDQASSQKRPSRTAVLSVAYLVISGRPAGGAAGIWSWQGKWFAMRPRLTHSRFVTTGRGLTTAERDRLKLDGYLLVPLLLGDSAVERLRARLAALVAQEVTAGHADHGNPDTVEAGVVHAKLDTADPGFRPLYDHSLLADAATAVLGDPWHICGLGLRAPLPGCGH